MLGESLFSGAVSAQRDAGEARENTEAGSGSGVLRSPSTHWSHLIVRAWLILALSLTACDAVVTPLPTPTAPPTGTPTPRATATLAPGAFLTPIPPTVTLTPSPTPTPVVHVVEQGNTLLGIALEYGVTVDALVQVNGLDPSQYLHIGQVLIIPLGEEEELTDMGIVVPVGNMILATPTPLPLDISGVALYQTPVGGVWCMGEVVNTTGSPVTNLQVQAALVAHDGTPLALSVALAAADYLAPSGRAPFAVLFKSPPSGYTDVRVSLLRGETVSAITADFTPLDVVHPVGAVSGPQYRVTGQLVNNTGISVSRISVVVTLYDREGKVIGYRQMLFDKAVTLSPGQSKEFKLLLTPQGLEPPASFQVLAWGVS
ncbi:MAG TPA: FxLYD domain-containing protein [Anaerolineae bacterium]|nr:FxLYD domain-containing protein [Anaerolineae bacterium]HQI85357.1 FxLYD domain-containing protein [Anaerolineae bacterium]